jgi:hypothetical protein
VFRYAATLTARLCACTHITVPNSRPESKQQSHFASYCVINSISIGPADTHTYAHTYIIINCVYRTVESRKRNL